MQIILGQNHIIELVALFIRMYGNLVNRYFMYFATALTNNQIGVECQNINMGNLIVNINVEYDIQ